jgi:hypothetical protein
MFNLDSYYLSYEITAVPYTFYVGLVKANEVLHFTNEIQIPPALKPLPIECRFILYDAEGQLVDFVSEIASYQTVTALTNTIPLKMLKNLISSFNK